MNHITFDRRKISIMTHKIWFTTSALHKSYCCNNYFYCISSYSCGGKSLHSVFIVLSKHILQQCNFNNWAQGELKDIFSRQWIELFQMRIWIEPHTHTRTHTNIYLYRYISWKVWVIVWFVLLWFICIIPLTSKYEWHWWCV